MVNAHGIALDDEFPEDVREALNPPLLKDFMGQPQAVMLLERAIAGARQRGTPLGHTLVYGPPGLGKTTLAALLAREMGGELRTVMAPSISRPGDLVAILVSLKRGDVLFIDEVHRLQASFEEMLYTAMEYFRLDISLDDPMGIGGSGGAVSIPLKSYCLVGATTRPGMLSQAFRDRFISKVELMPYGMDDMCRIVKRAAGILNLPLQDGAAEEVALRSRGTPRLGNTYLHQLRDHVAFEGMPYLDARTAREAFVMLRIDANGLDEMDRRYLDVLSQRFRGRAVGLSTLVSVLGMDADTIQHKIEPWLLQKGLIERTPKGRMLAEPQDTLL